MENFAQLTATKVLIAHVTHATINKSLRELRRYRPWNEMSQRTGNVGENVVDVPWLS